MLKMSERNTELKLMKDKEKAKIIINALGMFVQINWSFEDVYIDVICSALKEIKDKERGEADDRTV